MRGPATDPQLNYISALLGGVGHGEFFLMIQRLTKLEDPGGKARASQLIQQLKAGIGVYQLLLNSDKKVLHHILQKEIPKVFTKDEELSGSYRTLAEAIVFRSQGNEVLEQLQSIRSVPTYQGAKHNSLCITLINGKCFKVSVRKALYNYSDFSLVAEAARREVRQQIVEFKRQLFMDNNSLVCALSGMELDWNNTHIDHAHPKTFKRLLESFLRHHSITPAEVSVKFGLFKDRCLAEYWQTYHANQAVLRALHKKVNQSLSDGPPIHSSLCSS